MSSIFSFIGSRLGVLYGLIQAFIGGIFYDGSTFALQNERRCCADLSLSGLERIDARSSASILSSMRSTTVDAPVMAHEGDRLTPNFFLGIWWMDGNPAAEVLTTLADAYFRAKDEFRDVRHLYVPTLDFEGGTWAYNDSPGGRALFINQCTNDVQPQFVMNENRTRMLYQGDPTDENNEMTYYDDDTYAKPIFRGLKTYTLRRIIDAEGLETAHWDMWLEFISKSKRRESLLTYRRRGRDESCHTDLIEREDE